MTRTTGASTDADQYAVRQFEAPDVESVLDLDRAVWDRRRSPEWFNWKYAENPYLDHTPVFVVERAGEVVGARPLLAFRLRAGSETALALQPADTMVHPDHRRQGLFTRMTERTLEFYASRAPELFFNFPNEAALGGYRKLGWQPVATRRTFYRVEDPATFLSEAVDGRVGEALAAVSRPLASGLYGLRRRLASEPDGVAVEVRDGADPGLLAALYERAPPREVHAQRDREFYEWWLAGPAWDYRTLLARRGGEVVAALVARTRTTDGGVTVTQLADVVPLTGGPAWEEALRALVRRVVAEGDGEDLFSAVDSAIPDEVLVANGLLPGHAPPLRQLRDDDSTFAVRPTNPEEPAAWTLGGRSLLDREEWLFSFCEHDTA